MTEKEALQEAGAALDSIDSATTEAGTALTGIQAKFESFMQQIADANSLPEAQAIAARAAASAANLAPIASALTAMAQSPSDPVPVPVPEPPPVEG